MELITKAQAEQLLANGRAQRAAIDKGGISLDLKPVVKLFTPDAQCTWLLTELHPDGDLAVALCDLGMGEPELGYVSLAELATVRGKLGLAIERDLHVEADNTPAIADKEARQLMNLPTDRGPKSLRDMALLATLLYRGLRCGALPIEVENVHSRRGVLHLRHHDLFSNPGAPLYIAGPCTNSVFGSSSGARPPSAVLSVSALALDSITVATSKER